MNINLEIILGYAAAAIGVLGGWFAMKFGLDRANEKIQESTRQMEAFWKWKESHEKENSSSNETINRDIARLEGTQLVQTEQYRQIISLLKELRDEWNHWKDQHKN